VVDVGLIDQALRRAGVPVVGVQCRRGAVTVQYEPGATADQRAQGDALVAAWDDAAEQRRAVRRLAKAALDGKDDPTQVASRNSLRLIYASLVENRQAFNALRLHVVDPANNPLPPALTVRSWKQALGGVRQQIDAETDPEG